MSQDNKSVFIDESGDSNLETKKEGVTQHYCICAIILNTELVPDQLRQAEEIRKKYFQTGEMKSSQVGSNLPRRLEVLRALASLNLSAYCLVVDETALNKDSGLLYKRSFIKYTHGWLLRRIFRAFSSVSVMADRHGGERFMEGFIHYVQRNHVRELFSEVSYCFEESVRNSLLQVADFVAGSVRIAMECVPEDSATILQIVRPIAIRIEEWPIRKMLIGTDDLIPSTAHDEVIQDQALRQASLFLTENYANPDPDIILQVETLNYLLHQFTVVDPRHYTSTEELLSILNGLEEASISPYRFRTRVIGRLRDEGVIIASSPKGYKIPGSIGDIHDFVSHANLIVTPMLKRLALARSAILMASDRRCDIVGSAEHEMLRRILDAAPHNSEHGVNHDSRSSNLSESSEE